MDYKHLLRSQKLRFWILTLFSWIPDSIMVPIQYRIKVGFWPDLKHPKRFTEKIQLYKLQYRDSLMHQCVDKFNVRKFVEGRGLGFLLNEIYGVFDSIEDIPFDTLPNQYVLKNTLGSGGQNVIIVDDKNAWNLNHINKVAGSWLKTNNIGALYGREWAYRDCKPRILIEKLLEDKNHGLIEYKFFCFNGIPQFLYVLSDRIMGRSVKLGIYDMEFNKMDVYRCDEEREIELLEKPKNFEGMVEIAQNLSSVFPHVRVDLYNIEGNIYFGELTFYDGSGYFHYDPDEFDFKVGEWFTKYN